MAKPEATTPNPKAPPESRWRKLILPALCLLVLGTIAWVQRPDGKLHLYVLSGPGDAIVIQSPKGRFILIDGGSNPSELTLALGRLLPFWQRELYAVILTGGDGQRVPGQVAALSRYNVGLALGPSDLGRHGTAGEWQRLVASQRIPARSLQPGQRIAMDGVKLHVLDYHPGEHGGAVLLISYGATSALIHTGGPAGDPAALQLAGQPFDLLVYPWQRELTPMAALQPTTIIFTPAYEAPAPALLSYADRRQHARQVFHPKADGMISLVSDGHRLRLEP
ncbi:MAG: hypothetical protein AB4911_02270 [Oscillochloridaceae bacterium umkhey_bin13]